MSTNAITKPEEKPLTIRDHLESAAFQQQIAKVLPSHITPTRMVRIAITAMMKNPKLYDCSQESLFNSLLKLSGAGLEPDGRLAHLIPYGTTCTAIIDWKGLAQVAFWSGLVSSQCAEVIYEGDLFGYSCGLVSQHVPWWLRRDPSKPKTQGAAIGAFANATMKDGTRQSVVMSAAEILAIKSKSKSKDKGPWVDNEMEMWKKTAYRRLSKWLPIANERFTIALEADDETDGMRKVEGESSTIESFRGLPQKLEDPPPTQLLTEADSRADLEGVPPPPKSAEQLPDLINAKLRELDITWSQFTTMMVIQDERVTAKQANGIKDMLDVPEKVLEFYAGADRKFTQLEESAKKFLKGELL